MATPDIFVGWADGNITIPTPPKDRLQSEPGPGSPLVHPLGAPPLDPSFSPLSLPGRGSWFSRSSCSILLRLIVANVPPRTAGHPLDRGGRPISLHDPRAISPKLCPLCFFGGGQKKAHQRTQRRRCCIGWRLRQRTVRTRRTPRFECASCAWIPQSSLAPTPPIVFSSPLCPVRGAWQRPSI